MPRLPHHAALALTVEEKEHLDQLRQSRTASVRDVQRAQILWRYHAGETVTQIARVLKTTRNSVVKWIDKALQMGVVAGMKDTPHKPREAVITDDAKAWVVHLACSKPKDLGYAAELWTRSALAHMCAGRLLQGAFRRWLMQARLPFSASSPPRNCSRTRLDTTWSAAIPASKQGCGKSCWSTKTWRWRTKPPPGVVDGPTLSRFPWMKSRASKPSPILLRICRPSLVNIPRSPAIMSTSGMGRGRFWPASICLTDTSSPVSRSGTGALNSSGC